MSHKLWEIWGQAFLGTITLILCAEKDDVEVEFALKTNPLGAAEHQLQARLPAEFKGCLPGVRQLASVAKDNLRLRAADFARHDFLCRGRFYLRPRACVSPSAVSE